MKIYKYAIVLIEYLANVYTILQILAKTSISIIQDMV